MCVYCVTGDHFGKYDPPWKDFWRESPYIPHPVPQVPQRPDWSLERLIEVHDLLHRIKELEDKLGCPCEPNKADYISILRKRIEDLEKKSAASKTE